MPPIPILQSLYPTITQLHTYLQLPSQPELTKIYILPPQPKKTIPTYTSPTQSTHHLLLAILPRLKEPNVLLLGYRKAGKRARGIRGVENYWPNTLGNWIASDEGGAKIMNMQVDEDLICFKSF